jgi:hypothetical protein
VVQDFIMEYIESVDALEILLFLRNTPETDWSANAVSKALELDPNAVSVRLDHLKHLALIQERGGGDKRLYRYHPPSPEVASAISELAQAYSTYRVRIIEMIFSKPLTKIRTFSDAFRLNADDEDT